MGELIRFRPRQEVGRPTETPAKPAVSAEGGAQILLFLGVRYERHDGPEPTERKGQSKRGRQKKRA